MKKVVVTDQAFGNTRAEAAAAKAAGAGFFAHQAKDEEDTAAAVQGAHAIFNNFAPMTRAVMSRMAPDAVIVRYGVGVDNVDLEAARELGIRVCNVPDYGVNEVADHTCAMAVFLARKIHHFDAAVRQGKWQVTDIVTDLRSLSQTNVGLIGFGRIARLVAKRLQAFGCEVTVHDPFIDPAVAATLNVRVADLAEVISGARILSLHAPLLPGTRHLLNAERIAALPKQAIIINTSRGGLIDEPALAAALKSGHIAAAGLDVFETEPLPECSPLYGAPNLYMTPHAAFFSDVAVCRLQRLAAEEVLRALQGRPLRCRVV